MKLIKAAEWRIIMKKYNVTVNGTVYEVEVEEIGEVSAPAAVAEAPKAAAPVAAKPAAPKAAAPKAPAAAAGAVKIEAPMPGTVTKIVAKVGDSVKSGDTLLAFEAMKMEQEIKAPKDGVVAGVHVSQGASINQGDLLVSLN